MGKRTCDPTPSMKDTEERPRKRPGRAPVSCAECRRLKLRCDRKQPCENCSKRGCAAICPHGQLAGGKGSRSRMVLANTEELHEKIDNLCMRVRELEEALRLLQAAVSTDPHPLLKDELLQIKLPVQMDRDLRSSSGTPPFEDEEAAMVDSLGILSIGENGETSYLGSTARADYLLHDCEIEHEQSKSRLPPELEGYYWPDLPPSPPNKPRICELLIDHLPSEADAYGLAEGYLANGAWLGAYLSREEVYRTMDKIYLGTKSRTVSCPHRLAMLYMIFSMAVLFDLSRPIYSEEAAHYYALARVAFALSNPINETTVWTVQTLVHMTRYNLHTDIPENQRKSFAMLGIAGKLALSMGLHHDSSRFKLDDTASKQRHDAFWAIYLAEAMQSHSTGRPPLLAEHYISCPSPMKTPPGDCQDFDVWVVNFFRIIRCIMNDAFGSKPPTYKKVLELDVKLREYITPKWLVLNPSADHSQMLPTLVMQQWVVLFFKETFLLHLHRSFLVHALSENPGDITKSRYGQSVAVCYRSAFRIIEGFEAICRAVPTLVCRVGCFYDQVVSAAIVMALLVTRAQRSNLVAPAMEKLDTVCELMQKHALQNRAVLRNIDGVRELQRQARAAIDRSLSEAIGIVMPDLSPSAMETDDSLKSIWGKTRLVSRPSKSSSPSSSFSHEPQRRAPGASLRDILHETGQQGDQGQVYMDGIKGIVNGQLEAYRGIPVPAPTTYPYIHNDTSMLSMHPPSASSLSFTLPFWTIPSGTGSLGGGVPINTTNSGPMMMNSSSADASVDVGDIPMLSPEYQLPGLDVTWHGFLRQLGF